LSSSVIVVVSRHHRHLSPVAIVIVVISVVVVVVIARCAIAIIVDFVARRVVAIDVFVIVARRNRTGYVTPSPSLSSLPIATVIIVTIIVNFVTRCSVVPLPSLLSSSTLVIVVVGRRHHHLLP
jgi:hypothetical protein